MDGAAPLNQYTKELSDLIKNSGEQHRLRMLKLDQMNLDLDKRLKTWGEDYKQQMTHITTMDKFLLYEMYAMVIAAGLLVAVKLITPYFTP